MQTASLPQPRHKSNYKALKLAQSYQPARVKCLEQQNPSNRRPDIFDEASTTQPVFQRNQETRRSLQLPNARVP